MLIDYVLWFILIFLSIITIKTKDLYSSSFIFGAYSLIICLLWTRLNAVDVAFTEAAVGAGVSTVFLIAAILRTTSKDRQKGPLLNSSVIPIICVGLFLAFGMKGLPDYGDPEAPSQKHVAPRYIEKVYEETGVPNIVTGILASYRGYDTLGETGVVFTAAASVILLLRRKRD